MEPKRLAAERAVEFIEDHMVVGLGTGSTAYFAIKKIGERVKEGLKVRAVCTSKATEDLAKECGIPIVPFTEIDIIDLTIDGADEVDEYQNLIKGGGGALLREKIVAYHSKRFIVVVVESKLVKQLGKFPLPIEVIPFGVELTMKQLEGLGGEPVLRQKEGKIFITDNGNYITDCRFFPITEPANLHLKLKLIPGVVETGIFSHTIVSQVVVGYPSGKVEIL